MTAHLRQDEAGGRSRRATPAAARTLASQTLPDLLQPDGTRRVELDVHEARRADVHDRPGDRAPGRAARPLRPLRRALTPRRRVPPHARYHLSWFEYQTAPGSGKIKPSTEEWFHRRSTTASTPRSPFQQALAHLLAALEAWVDLTRLALERQLNEAWTRLEPLKVTKITEVVVKAEVPAHLADPCEPAQGDVRLTEHTFTGMHKGPPALCDRRTG